MPGPERVVIARDDGKNYRTVGLTVSKAAIELDAHDMGASVEAAFNRDDYEFSVSVNATDYPNLMKALLREKYSGDLDAVDAFQKFCEENEIPCRFDSWP